MIEKQHYGRYVKNDSRGKTETLLSGTSGSKRDAAEDVVNENEIESEKWSRRVALNHIKGKNTRKKMLYSLAVTAGINRLSA